MTLSKSFYYIYDYDHGELHNYGKATEDHHGRAFKLLAKSKSKAKNQESCRTKLYLIFSNFISDTWMSQLWQITPKIAEHHKSTAKLIFVLWSVCYKLYIALATVCCWKMQLLTFRFKFRNCVRSYCSLRPKFGDTSLWMTLDSWCIAPFRCCLRGVYIFK